MSANFYWCQQSSIGVSKLLLVSAKFYWCQQTSIGVSKLLLVSAKFYWCQQTSVGVSKVLLVSANFYWCPKSSIGVSKVLLVSANFYWCQQTSIGVSKFYLVHNLAPNHHINKHRHCINTVPNCSMFQHLQGHLQGEQVIHSSSAGQQHESPAVQFNLLHTQLNFTTGGSCR